MPLGRRAIYRYLRACEPVAGRRDAAQRRRPAGDARARLRRAISAISSWRGTCSARRSRGARAVRAPPVRGDELARAVGLRPGPELGQILAGARGGELRRGDHLARAGDRASPRAMSAGRGQAAPDRARLPVLQDRRRRATGDIVAEDERTVAFMDLPGHARARAGGSAQPPAAGDRADVSRRRCSRRSARPLRTQRRRRQPAQSVARLPGRPSSTSRPCDSALY